MKEADYPMQLKDALPASVTKSKCFRQKFVNGDYHCGHWLIEAKSIDDLMQSMRNGHLMRQLDNMDANSGNFGLVIHGERLVIMLREQNQ